MTEETPPIPDGMSEEPVSVYDNDYVQQPVPDGEPVVGPEVETAVIRPPVASSLVTGGEGFGVVRRRHLLVLIPLPVYLLDPKWPDKGIDKTRQNIMLADDIRDAMAKAARKLNDTAMKYSVTGYTWDLDEIQYDMPRARTLSATLVIERE